MERISYTRSPDRDEILKNHAERYPEMTPQDAVKLLFQSVFGPGHLISDPNAAAERLRDELRNCPSRETVCPDEIGGGFARLHLTENTDPDYGSFAFLKSDEAVGSTEELMSAVENLRRLTADGVFSFQSDELNSYLDGYIAAGCPMVSHTPAYREAYAPAYRVVRREFLLLEPLIRKIREVSSRQNHTVVVIDGFCASGKTTLARFLASVFDARLIHMDDFFLPPEKRTPERFAEPGGNVDYERFKEEVIGHLSDDSLTCGVFDCGEMAVTSHLTLPKTSVTVIEGAYSHHPAFGNYFDVDAFVQTSSEEQLRRIRERDGEDYLPMFVNRWIPFEKSYESAYSVRSSCQYLIET